MTAYKRKIRVLPVVTVVFLFALFGSCDLKKQAPAADTSISFSKIYDKSDTHTYTAVDIKQTDDGGYIILGMVDHIPYLLKLDREGNAEWDTTPEDYSEYRQPIRNLLVLNGSYHFFCNKKEETEGAGLRDFVLLKVNQDRKPEEVNIFGNNFPIIMQLGHVPLFPANLYTLRPLHALNVHSNLVLFLIFSEKFDRIFVLELDENYGMKFFSRNIEYKCAYSNPFLDKRFHFINEFNTAGNDFYYFQSYSTDNNDPESPCFSIGKLKPDAPTSTLSEKKETPKSTPFIAMAWDGSYSYKALVKNHIISFTSYSDISIVDDGNLHQQPELIDSKPVFIKTMLVDQKRGVFSLGSSKNNRMVLYAYNHDPVEELLINRFTNKEYFGHTHIFEAKGLIETKDNGLAILGTNYVAGQLGRICVFKLSKETLAKLLSGET